MYAGMGHYASGCACPGTDEVCFSGRSCIAPHASPQRPGEHHWVKSVPQGCVACIGKCRTKGFGALPNKHFATQKVFLYRRKHCLLALRTVKLLFQSSRVIFLGRSPAEEHLPGIIQAKECMKKKKHISEEQHYLCEIGLEKMPYGSFWLYKSYTEESLTHITITAAPCKVPALP